MEISFSNPIYLWGLMAVPVLTILYFISLKYSGGIALKFANFVALSRVAGKIGEPSNILGLIARILALICVILSISGMTIWYYGESANKDYVVAIDSSASMSMEKDFKPNRMEAVKIAAINFIDKIPLTSKVGVLSFAGTSFVEQPLTEEKGLAKLAVQKISLSESGGTDIGNAIMTGVNMLLDSKKSKTVILLTDGRSNVGMSDLTAIAYASTYHVSVHTIGIGTKETKEDLLLGVDEDALKRISNSTDGNYFYVANEQDLGKVYEELIKNPPKGNNPVNLSFGLLIAALILLLLDWTLGSTIYRRII